MTTLLLLLFGCPYVGTDAWLGLQDIDDDQVVDPRFDGPDCDPTTDAVGDCDADRDGHRAPPFGDDCDDGDPDVNPEATERCNGIDDDCDGTVDVAVDIPAELLVPFYRDDDGDGFGAEAVLACEAPVGTVSRDGDCDDSDASVAPDAPELCDAVDHDCDGDPRAGAIDVTAWYPDGDGDGVGAGTVPLASSCEPPDGAGPPGDCDDGDPQIAPGLVERCNGVDDDCDGAVDDADGDVVVDRVWTVDLDDDGYGAVGSERAQCAAPGEAYIVDGPADCDDEDPSVQVSRAWYPDADGDGVGDEQAEPLSQCLPPTGEVPYVTTSSDCDDGDSSVGPGRQELCNGVDDDCDGTIDDGTVGFPWYVDDDRDGFGTGEPEYACEVPGVAYSPTVGDCDDTDPTVSPLGVERCNGADDDCDGLVDDEDPDSTGGISYLDADGDGYGAAGVPFSGCEVPPGFAEQDGDCDDTDPTLYHQFSTVGPADSTELQAVVDATCDGGVVLLEGIVEVDGIQIPARNLVFASSDPMAPAVLTPKDGSTRPVGLFGVATEGSLTLQGVVIRPPENTSGWTPANDAPYMHVSRDAEVSILSSRLEDLHGNEAIVFVGRYGRLTVEDVEHTGITTGEQGLYQLDRFAEVTFQDVTFEGVEARTDLSDVGVLLTSERSGSLAFEGIRVHGSATRQTTHLFGFTGGGFGLEPVVLDDLLVTDSGQLAVVDDHELQVTRMRAENSGDGVSAANPLLEVVGGGLVGVRNSELIASGGFLLTDGSARVETSAIAHTTGPLFTGSTTAMPLCDVFTIAIERGLRAEVVDSVFYAHGPVAEDDRGELALIGSFTGNRLDATATVPNVTDSILTACERPTATNTAEPIADLLLVQPDPTPASDWGTVILHPYQDFCVGGYTSPLVDAERGTMGGAGADRDWVTDTDGDRLADAWERYWFGDLESCEQAAVTAYETGEAPADLDPPACGVPPTCVP